MMPYCKVLPKVSFFSVHYIILMWFHLNHHVTWFSTALLKNNNKNRQCSFIISVMILLICHNKNSYQLLSPTKNSITHCSCKRLALGFSLLPQVASNWKRTIFTIQNWEFHQTSKNKTHASQYTTSKEQSLWAGWATEAWCEPQGMSASRLKCAFEALATTLIHLIGPLRPEAIKTFKKWVHVEFTSSIMALGAGNMPMEPYKQFLV